VGWLANSASESFICAAVAVKVVNETSSEDSATIWLQVGNIASNLTIRYGPCSEPSLSYTTVAFMIPAIQLVNLTASTTYCYSMNVTDTAGDATIGSSYGTFTTAAKATTAAETITSPTMPAPVQPYGEHMHSSLAVIHDHHTCMVCTCYTHKM